MKSVFDTSVREELIKRIYAVNPKNNAEWGKMNAFQMLKHCTLCEDMYLGKLKIKRVLIGRLFGPMVLKKVLKDDTPFGKNAPTSSLLKTINENGDVELQKREWIGRIEQYGSYSNPNFVHPFFGPMTAEQVGYLAYKHIDHHLRQFGV
jgi:hypothetical protein